MDFRIKEYDCDINGKIYRNWVEIVWNFMDLVNINNGGDVN